MRHGLDIPSSTRPHLVDARDMEAVLAALDDGSMSLQTVISAIVARFCVDLDLLTETVRSRRAA